MRVQNFGLGWLTLYVNLEGKRNRESCCNLDKVKKGNYFYATHHQLKVRIQGYPRSKIGFDYGAGVSLFAQVGIAERYPLRD